MPPDFQMYCGASPSPWCAPGDSVACLGHLFVLDETPRAWYVLEEAECGPRRWPERTPSLLRGGCWRRRGRTLWVWQENMERLPLPGTIPVSSPSMNGLISAVGATGLWLIEPPRNTPEFGARYARNQGASAEPPQFGRLLDRLQFAWELTGTRPYCVALFDPGGGCDAEGQDRLARRCSKFAVFPRRVDAVRWLLGHVPGAPGIRTPMPAPTPAPPQSATNVMTLLGPPSKPLLPALGSPERPLLVRLTDIGGAAARQLLGTLHSRTLSAWTNRGDSGLPLGMGRHETRVDLRADPTCDGLSCAAAYALGGGEAGPLAELPEWRGRVKRRWRVEQFVTVMLDSLQPSRPCGLVIGVGAARLFGGRELAAVVESCWAGDRRPAAMLLAADADARLVEWAVAEFPETPLFEATGEGAWRALAKAMDIAGGVRQ